MISLLAVAASSGNNLLNMLVPLVVVGVILYIVWWGICHIPMIEPIATVVKAIFVIAAVIIAISFLLPLANLKLF
jgi:hypothetical protein